MIKSFIKKMLPHRLFLVMVSLRNDISFFLLRIMGSNKIFAYFSLISSRSYLEEHFVSLQGSYKYESSMREERANIFFLRRNIHRLEKGLLMKPMRKEFALSYIKPTVENFARLPEAEYKDIKEWGTSVLSMYFKVTESEDSRYIDSRQLFISQKEENLGKGSNVQQVPYTPYRKIAVDVADLENLLKTRKSVRWFSEQIVPKEVFSKATELARLSPNSCNRQPYRYVVSNNPENARRLANISGGTLGWGDNVPAIAILIGQQRAFSGVSNRHTVYIDSSLTVMPFVLALETLGLSTCIINWVDSARRVSEIRKVLDLDNDERIIMSVAVGYRDDKGKVAYSRRVDVEEVLEFID